MVVLNLFVEYLPQVITESFAHSLLTAVLLKAVLEVVSVVKNRVRTLFREASAPLGKVGAGLLLWLVLVGSTFVVFGSVNVVFGPRVSHGGSFS